MTILIPHISLCCHFYAIHSLPPGKGCILSLWIWRLIKSLWDIVQGTACGSNSGPSPESKMCMQILSRNWIRSFPYMYTLACVWIEVNLRTCKWIWNKEQRKKIVPKLTFFFHSTGLIEGFQSETIPLQSNSADWFSRKNNVTMEWVSLPNCALGLRGKRRRKKFELLFLF